MTLKQHTDHPRVLMFGWEFPPYNSGGLGVACRGLIQGLVQAGVQVTLVLPKRIPLEENLPYNVIFADDRYEEVTDEGTPLLLSAYLTAEEYRRRKSAHGGVQNGLSIYEEVARYAYLARSIARRMANEVDVIHTHDWLTFQAGHVAAEETGLPVVAHVHATEFDRGGGNSINETIYQIERAGVHQADHVVSVSQFTKNILTEHYGVPAEKITPIHNGINPDEYPKDSIDPDQIVQLKRQGYKIVLFVGRLTLQKGPDYFIDAAKGILEHEPSTFFVVAGSGDMQTKLIRRAAANGLSHRFIFAGFLRGAALRQLYASAELYIMPSVSEPFGITPLESLIEGTPVLISKQSGVSECLDHALTVDFWDVDEIVNKTVSVLRHPGLHATLRENGYRDVFRQSWHKAAAKVKGLYGTMLLGSRL